MAQANTSKRQLRYVKQSWAFGAAIPTGGSTPKLTNARSTDWSMSAGKTTQQSEELRADSMPSDSVLVGLSGSGQSNFELSFNTHNDFLENVCRSTFSAAVTTTATASVAASGNNWDLTVTASAAFAVGQWVRTTAFATSPTVNNGVFVVLSKPNATTLRLSNPAGTVTTAQTATVTSSRMLRMGTNVQYMLVEGEHSDINAFQRLEDARVASLSLSLSTQQKVTGTIQFQGRRVQAPPPEDVTGAGTSGNLQFAAGPPGTITGPTNTWTGGPTVAIAVGDFVKIVNSPNATNNGIYKASVVTGTVLTVTNTDGSAKTFIAENNSTATVSQYATVGDAIPTAATTTSILNASTNVGSLTEAGTALGVAISAFDMTIDGQLQPVTQVGSASLAGITDGTFAVTGTLTAYYENNTLYNKVIADAETSHSGRFTDAAGNIMIYTVPRMKLEGDPGGGGQNTLIPLPLKYSALLDPATSTLVQFDLLP